MGGLCGWWFMARGVLGPLQLIAVTVKEAVGAFTATTSSPLKEAVAVTKTLSWLRSWHES